ncbi:hypothetical protein [Methylotuvimicrobium buryatense]|uniref:Roadblock/LC7 domain-containing protein n=1 Tax=Methylotuvimicrobium buryatense TaxID=95641 RepID=A0A4P9UL34_METBY|nr:hypothetical protein [Methylotuvimicrobium buryatense]QCW81969.1 hypothetical protein EQU24_06680 [Methylotuvimicrobium buryatense]
MADYKLSEGLFLLPTPAGAYYAVASREQDKARQFLRSLFRQQRTPALTEDSLLTLMENDEPHICFERLHHCQRLGLVQGLEQAIEAPSGAFEQILPNMLGSLTENGKVLLADHQGFYLVCHGFAHETAEELSALGAEIASIHERRSGLLFNNMGLNSHAWAVVDAAGNSQVGFWPLFIGETRFIVAISGMPHFNRPEFVELVWALFSRYAANRK